MVLGFCTQSCSCSVTWWWRTLEVETCCQTINIRKRRTNVRAIERVSGRFLTVVREWTQLQNTAQLCNTSLKSTKREQSEVYWLKFDRWLRFTPCRVLHIRKHNFISPNGHPFDIFGRYIKSVCNILDFVVFVARYIVARSLRENKYTEVTVWSLRVLEMGTANWVANARTLKGAYVWQITGCHIKCLLLTFAHKVFVCRNVAYDMHTKVHRRGKLFVLHNTFDTTLMHIHTSAVKLGHECSETVRYSRSILAVNYKYKPEWT